MGKGYLDTPRHAASYSVAYPQVGDGVISALEPLSIRLATALQLTGSHTTCGFRLQQQ
jgi:hypothetical protein